jgi:hypothetical protein
VAVVLGKSQKMGFDAALRRLRKGAWPALAARLRLPSPSTRMTIAERADGRFSGFDLPDKESSALANTRDKVPRDLGIAGSIEGI